MTDTYDTGRARPRVAIIGSGFAGVGAAIALERAGIADVVVLERADSVGGVWRDNDYPGAACDVQSHLYSYSFAPNSEWQNMFARRDEILAYFERVTDEFGIGSRVLLNCAVREMHWDADAACWTLHTARGEIEAEHVVVATGALADPVVPGIPGRDRFEGPVFHSARWDHSFDLRGKRVAVVGTGASAIQFVPEIQPLVEQLTVFQRTAPWVVPRHDRPIGERERAVLRSVPLLQKAARLRIYLERELTLLGFRNPALMAFTERTARNHLRKSVSDVGLRAKLTPDYRLGCKRILISNDYLPALDAPNADVVTSGVREFTARAVVDNDGVEHPVDAVIFGTGFETDRLPLTDRIYGPGGATMAEVWGQSPSAYLGTTVTGFPNVYLMHGPNIALGHTSVLTMFESQINYLVEAIRYSAEHECCAIEPSPEAQARFRALVDRLTDGSVWTAGGCSSWYLDATGRNSNLWPGSTLTFRRMTRRFQPSDHVLRTVGKELIS
ncbi:flavin-containing monooxygenase [Nocardia sp. NPDC058518]|uniref:flavin-containing monooxygenase n=1 Tax=Nocardia sp. NPDC058518 TaxID=3346534 RepID=UPI00365E6B83